MLSEVTQWESRWCLWSSVTLLWAAASNLPLLRVRLFAAQSGCEWLMKASSECLKQENSKAEAYWHLCSVQARGCYRNASTSRREHLARLLERGADSVKDKVGHTFPEFFHSLKEVGGDSKDNTLRMSPSSTEHQQRKQRWTKTHFGGSRVYLTRCWEVIYCEYHLLWSVSRMWAEVICPAPWEIPIHSKPTVIYLETRTDPYFLFSAFCAVRKKRLEAWPCWRMSAQMLTQLLFTRLERRVFI